MSTTAADETHETELPRIIGQVKWFNNKAGYGFITVTSGEDKGKDIFIHYSAIRVVNTQYKYLVQGEYVEFSLVKSTSTDHEYQAVDISGINGGSLMCETRNNTGSNSVDVDRKPVFSTRRRRVVNRSRDDQGAGAGSVESNADNGEFTTVQRRRPTIHKSRGTVSTEVGVAAAQ